MATAAVCSSDARSTLSNVTLNQTFVLDMILLVRNVRRVLYSVHEYRLLDGIYVYNGSVQCAQQRHKYGVVLLLSAAAVSATGTLRYGRRTGSTYTYREVVAAAMVCTAE